MTIKVKIVGAPTRGAKIFYELFKEAISTEVEYGGSTDAYERVNPYERIDAPCKSANIDDSYTGKCKKFRKEARGWR